MSSVKLLKASAGSGKTYQLSYEYVKGVISNPDQYRSTLAVTFTNKATEEMKRRIIGEINDLANGRTAAGKKPAFLDSLCAEFNLSGKEISRRAEKVRTRILHDYSHFTILTIDKFFQRIIRAFIRELGIESDFTLELKTDSVLGSAADRLIEDTTNDSKLRGWIVDFVEEQIADGKRWNVRDEITALGKEIFKEHFFGLAENAPTRDEALKIVHECTRKAEKVKQTMISHAQNAISIIEQNNLSVDDFHSGKTGFSNYFYKVASGDVESAYGTRVKNAIADDVAWYTKTASRKADIIAVIPQLRPLLESICSLYDENIFFINTTSLIRENFRIFSILTDLSTYVRDICDTRNVMLISDTNRIINRLIDGNDTPFIFEKVGNNFSHYMIDEFQDTSLSQWNNFYPLITNALSQSEDSPVLIVGDVKQSIYRWRGGDWKILGNAVSEAFANTETVSLDTNYRSDGVVIKFNNNIISQSVLADNALLNNEIDVALEKELLPQSLHTELENMLKNAYHGNSQKVANAERDKCGYVKIMSYEKQSVGEEESDDRVGVLAIETIEELQNRGYAARDIAIIVRYNYEASQIANALLEHKSSHPDSTYRYDVVTQEALTIGGSEVVRFIVSCFRIAINGSDNISRALYSKYLIDSINLNFSEEDEAFFRKMRLVSLEEAFQSIVIKYDLGNDSSNIAYIQAFHEQLITFASTKISDIPLFLKWWDESGSGESVNMPNGQDAITIITIHKAKGLQYPVVIMPYANWDMNPKVNKTLLWANTSVEPFAGMGNMPIKFKKTVAESYFAPYYFREKVYAHVDNVNTLYVALTRAERELYVMIPTTRRGAGSGVGDMILGCMQSAGDEVIMGDMRGVITIDNETIFEFGNKTDVTATDTAPQSENYAKRYPTYDFSGKIRLKRANERYFEDNEEVVELSPRSYGQIMHKVFENIVSLDDTAYVLDSLVNDGTISLHDREVAESRIAEAKKNPQICSWFDTEWDTIRNESDIIVPRSTAVLRRPDRVMISGNRVVVVDYKFGTLHNNRYIKQIKEYIALIESMGYTNVEGYLWYVETNTVEQV